jgi:hypothetical protein
MKIQRLYKLSIVSCGEHGDDRTNCNYLCSVKTSSWSTECFTMDDLNLLTNEYYPGIINKFTLYCFNSHYHAAVERRNKRLYDEAVNTWLK